MNDEDVRHRVRWWPGPSTLGVTVQLQDWYQRTGERRRLDVPGPLRMLGAQVSVDGSPEGFDAAKAFLGEVVGNTALLLTEDVAKPDAQFLAYFRGGEMLAFLEWEQP